jgi:UDP-N-acetylmuramoyl-tripeptide--D-alanyl-D-alanine ligase
MLRAFLRRATDPIYDFKRSARRRIAAAWRRMFRTTTFIGITGSHGKSTATGVLGAILARCGKTRVGVGLNVTRDIVMGILAARPGAYRYWVQEVAGERPMAIENSCRVLQPTIGIVTAIGGDHRRAFGSIEGIAAEKSKLVHRLPADGLAVLNADDPLVAAMAAGCACRVVTFGRAENADLRLLAARANWPERLTLEVAYRGEPLTVKTRLVSAQWSVSIMAALLAALELGASPSTCLAAIEPIEPLYNKMSPHPGPNGACLVLDAYKASFHGIEACLAFLDDAVAPRKTVVVGTIADYVGASRSHYYKVAHMALERADRVIFTGANANRVRRLATGALAGRLFIRERPQDLLQMLSEDALPDEIIYVKGTRADRLGRLFVPHG